MAQQGIILSKEDYEILSRFVKSNSGGISNNGLRKLATELQSAQIVEQEKLPDHTVRMRSKVKIMIEGDNKEMNLQLVLPSEADIKQNKISVFAPLGSALIGYRKGDTIAWEVPGGTKVFKILEVTNETES